MHANGLRDSESVAQVLARHIHAVRYEELPAEVTSYAKTLVLDSLGCLFGGFNSPPAVAVRDVVGRLGGTPASRIVGTGDLTSPSLAAFANGTAQRYLDFNDSFGIGYNTAHPSGNFPVALAVGEAERRSGKECLAALVAAYEVHLRLCCLEAEPGLKQRGWHNTSNLQFSAAALAARLLSDDPMVTANAMVISGTHQNTLAQFQRGEIPMIKATADGWIAKGAIEAALLANAGVTGPDKLFEGEAGFAATVAGGIDLEALIEPIGSNFHILNTRIKPFAAVGPAMAAVQAAVDLFATGRVRLEEISGVTIALPDSLFVNPATHEIRRHPESRESADHSFYYCIAIALLEGACGESQFTPDKLSSPLVHQLSEKIVIEGDPEFSALRPTATGGGVTVKMRDGSVLESRHTHPPGHPDNPLSVEQLHAKFNDLTGPYISSSCRRDIIAAVETLEDCDNLADFVRLLAEPDQPRAADS